MSCPLISTLFCMFTCFIYFFLRKIGEMTTAIGNSITYADESEFKPGHNIWPNIYINPCERKGTTH